MRRVLGWHSVRLVLAASSAVFACRPAGARHVEKPMRILAAILIHPGHPVIGVATAERFVGQAASSHAARWQIGCGRRVVAGVVYGGPRARPSASCSARCWCVHCRSLIGVGTGQTGSRRKSVTLDCRYARQALLKMLFQADLDAAGRFATSPEAAGRASRADASLAPTGPRSCSVLPYQT